MAALGSEEANAGRIAALKLAAHAAVLALVTALGLLVVGQTRGLVPWTVFALASLTAFLVVGVVARSLLRTGCTATGPRQDGDSLLAEAPSAESKQPYDTGRPDRESSRDEIDYLMALRHEFRTPLNAVLGFSDVLLSGIDGVVNASQREDLEIIRASGIRLRILLDSALDLSQMLRGEMRLETEHVDVGELVRRVAVEASQLWSSKRSVRCTLAADPRVAELDETRLRRSLLVLADFLATSHRDAELSVSLTSAEAHLAIEITAEPSDGVPLDSLPTPRETLTSEDAARIRRWPIAVTSEIIAQHGGSLYHGNAPSRFLIRLPVEAAR